MRRMGADSTVSRPWRWAPLVQGGRTRWPSPVILTAELPDVGLACLARDCSAEHLESAQGFRADVSAIPKSLSECALGAGASWLRRG